MTIDPRRLIHLLAIARAGTLGKAALELRVSQPALSNSIAALERSVGGRVMDRSRRGVSLNELGQRLFDRAEAMESILRTAEEDVQLKRLGLVGELRIGVSPVGCVAVVPKAVTLLREAIPLADVTVHELEDGELVDRLLKGTLDLAISPSGSRSEPKGISSQLLFSDRLVVAASRLNLLSRKRSVSIKQLSTMPLALPSRDTAIYRQIEGLFAASGARWPRSSISSNSLQFIKSMVRENSAVAIISNRIIEPEVTAGWVAAVQLKECPSTRDILVRRWKNAPRNVLVDRLVECLFTAERGEASAG